MTALPASRLLKLTLLVDAAMSGAAGLLMAGGAEPLGALLGLPGALLRGAGLALLPFAGLLGWLGTRQSMPRRALRLVVVVNLLWAAESLLLLAFWLTPNAMGAAFVAVQALAVTFLAAVQHHAMRRTAAVYAPA